MKGREERRNKCDGRERSGREEKEVNERRGREEGVEEK